jgi:probable rRNA maturation factor
VRKELDVGEGDVTVCLVSDAEIARMNEAYRKKKGATDVLSFPAVERRAPVSLRRMRKRSASRNEPGGHFLGDIAISPTTARRNAKQLGRTLSGELKILILHGVLHLLGYDHERDVGQMDRLEQRLRRRLGLT